MANAATAERAVLELADGWIDLDARMVVRASGRSRLSTNEAELLRRLAGTPRTDVSRDVLHREVLGMSERVVTRAVDHLVTRLRKKIELDPRHPRHLVTAHGIGYRFVPAARAPARLPSAGGALLGRERELAAIDTAFERGTRVTLVGGAGVGKTRLALEHARRVAAAGEEAVFVSLAECRTAAELPAALALALGARQPDLGHALDAPRLVVLDNAEHLLPDGAREIARLAATGATRWLVTSREALRIAGEQRIQIGSLAEAQALRLFVERARTLGVDIDPASPRAREICAALEGLPLAIELAAGRLPVLGLDGLATRLGDPLALLRARNRDASDRHASMEAALRGSWELLDEQEREALAACACFRSELSLDAAEAVIAPPDALDHLTRLVDRSLVQVRGTAASRRFVVPWVVRELALSEAANASALHLRHARHVLAEARRSEPCRAEPWPSLVHELDAVVERFPTGSKHHALAIEAALATLEHHAHHLGHEERETLADLAAGATERAAQLRAKLIAASLATVEGDAERALSRIDEATPLAEEPIERARVELARARAARHRWPDEANAAAARALSLAERAGDARANVEAWWALGVLARERGEHHEARVSLQRGLSVAEEAGDARGESVLLTELATTFLERGALREAAAAYQRAMTLDRVLEDAAREAIAATNLALIEHLEGELDVAAARQARALEVHRRVGDRRLIGFALACLGALAFERGELATAERRLLEAEASVKEVDPLLHAYVHGGLALLWTELGDTARAQEAVRRAAAQGERPDGRFATLAAVLTGSEGAGDDETADALIRLARRLVRARRARA